MEDIFEKAVRFAFKAHAGQVRKDGSMYILHPLEVASIVGTMTGDVEVLAAAVLHDTIEDTAVTAKEISENFGERILSLVMNESENEHEGINKSKTWKIRKEESLSVLKDADIDTKMLWLGDKLSNLRAIARNYEKIGLACFDFFNEKNPKEQRWYYEMVLEYVSELEEYGAYKEYKSLFCLIFDAVK